MRPVCSVEAASPTTNVRLAAKSGVVAISGTVFAPTLTVAAG